MTDEEMGRLENQEPYREWIRGLAEVVTRMDARDAERYAWEEAWRAEREAEEASWKRVQLARNDAARKNALTRRDCYIIACLERVETLSESVFPEIIASADTLIRLADETLPNEEKPA